MWAAAHNWAFRTMGWSHWGCEPNQKFYESWGWEVQWNHFSQCNLLSRSTPWLVT